MKDLLDVLQQIYVIPHDYKVSQIAAGSVPHVPILVAHQLTGSISVRLYVLLHHSHLKRAQHLKI